MCKLGHGGDYAVCAQQLGQTAQQQPLNSRSRSRSRSRSWVPKPKRCAVGGGNGQRLSRPKEDDSRWPAGEFKTAAAAVTAEMQAMPLEKGPGSGM